MIPNDALLEPSSGAKLEWRNIKAHGGGGKKTEALGYQQTRSNQTSRATAHESDPRDELVSTQASSCARSSQRLGVSSYDRNRQMGVSISFNDGGRVELGDW